MIDVIDHDRIRELRLARPPVNAINPALMTALRAEVKRAVDDDRAALVLSGPPGMFSAGLDVPALLTLGRDEIRAAWVEFFGLLSDLAKVPIPLGAALTGHSPAGGTVLALYADHRVLAEGPFRIGLNEVQVGLPVPEPLYRALTFWCGEREGTRLAVGGLLIDPAEALRVGLVDEVVAPDAVVARTLAWAKELTARPATALRLTRATARRALVESMATIDAAAIDGIVTQWRSDETQAVLRGLAARLGKPRS
jgi:enoyl-CoA hydratase/carnithine racemase